jgi:hypothetical protein
LQNISGRGIYKINGGGVSLSGITAEGISDNAVYCTEISSGSVTIDENSKFNNTGRVYVSASVSVQVTDTEIRNNSGDSALYVDSGSGSTTIERVTVDGVPDGRGIWANSSGMTLIVNSIIRNCTTTSDGAGIYNPDGTLTVEGLTLRNITGNGIHKTNGGGVSLSGINADGISGGAVYCTDISSGSFSIRDSKLTNTGRVYIYDCAVPVQVTDTEIRNNSGDSALSVGYRSTAATIERVTIDGVPRGRGIYIWSSSVRITDSTIRNCKTTGSGGGIYLGGGSSANHVISGVTIENVEATGSGGIDDSSGTLTISNTTIKNALANGNKDAWDGWAGGLRTTAGALYIYDSRFENCRAMNHYGAIEVGNAYGVDIQERILTNTVFLNCTGTGRSKILNAGDFSSIRDCTFTHDSNLVDMGPPNFHLPTTGTSFFEDGDMYFENCTFNNLKGNIPEIYLFNRYAYDGTGFNGVYGKIDLMLKNCTFNLNSGSAGILFLYAGNVTGVGNQPDYLLMDGCKITNNGGQQPLIQLQGNNPSNTFRFRLNNYYNGTLLDTAAKVNTLGSGVIRLTNGAQVTIVP